MTSKRFYVDTLLKETLKKEDRVKLPEDQEFYVKMENNIMTAITQVELETNDGEKQLSKWSKPWVFLEPSRSLEEGAVKLQSSNDKLKL